MGVHFCIYIIVCKTAQGNLSVCVTQIITGQSLPEVLNLNLLITCFRETAYLIALTHNILVCWIFFRSKTSWSNPLSHLSAEIIDRFKFGE